MLATLLAGSRIPRSDALSLFAHIATLRNPDAASLCSATLLSALAKASSSPLLAVSASVSAQAASAPTAASSARSISPADGGSNAGSDDSDGGGGTGGRWSRRWQPLLLVPGGVAACLGYWQLQRRQEKSEMLDRRRAAMEVQLHF